MSSSKDLQEKQKTSDKERSTGFTRKEFLFSAAGLFAVAGGLTRKNSFTKFASASTLTGTKMAILYDSSKCIGCKMCEKGCAKANKLPEETGKGELSKTRWTVIQSTKNSNGKNLFSKLQCMHCTDASCVSVCPTGAAEHKGEYVVIDQEVCIGCGYCEESCPFGVPHREFTNGSTKELGAAEKCTFCFEHVSSGSQPCCAEACPIGATTYGARSELLAVAKNKVGVLNKSGWPEARLYGEDELGGLGVMNILLKPPAFYGLPEQPKQATENVLAQWAGGSLIAAAIIAPIWYLHKRISGKDKQSVKQEEGSK